MTLAELPAAVAAVWAGVSPIEAVAAVLGLVYLVLVIAQQRAAWLAALASTALYLLVFYRARLYMQAALQLYYIAIALYGWYAWRRQPDGAELPVSRASLRVQAAGLAAIALASAASAALLARETGSAEPFLDSLTTWASVFTTWLVARKTSKPTLVWLSRLFDYAWLLGLLYLLMNMFKDTRP